MTEKISRIAQVTAWLERIRILSEEIGPRGPTGAGERKGAEYAQSEFTKFRLNPVWETFKSARSIFQPHLIGSLGMLLAFIIFPLGGTTTAVIAALLSILVLATELMELGFQNNLYRLILPKGESQNVHAVIPPSGDHTGDLVIVGHLDSQRTPFIFRSPKHVRFYDNFVTLVFITFILQVLVYSLAVFFHFSWAWYATIPTAICAAILAVICIEADSTPFTAGANDNATAAGMVLTLAEQFAKNPLEHTRVWAVCTGCEEVQHYGMIDFYRRHLGDLKNPKVLVFEMLGCAGPAWLTREGIIVPFKADPGLVGIVEGLAKEHPEWGAYPAKISGGNSEMADAIRNKIPAIALFGMTREGVAPYWHQGADTFDKMDVGVLERTWEFTNALIRKIDNP
jgi:hypothetical protein